MRLNLRWKRRKQRSPWHRSSPRCTAAFADPSAARNYQAALADLDATSASTPTVPRVKPQQIRADTQRLLETAHP
jgi:hypothetical protein